MAENRASSPLSPRSADRTSRTEGDCRVEGPDRPGPPGQGQSPPRAAWLGGPQRDRHCGCLGCPQTVAGGLRTL